MTREDNIRSIIESEIKTINELVICSIGAYADAISHDPESKEGHAEGFRRQVRVLQRARRRLEDALENSLVDGNASVGDVLRYLSMR